MGFADLGDISFHQQSSADDVDDELCDGQIKGQCWLCSGTSETPTPGGGPLRMVASNKDQFCHIVHLLHYGELGWKDRNGRQGLGCSVRFSVVQ